MWQQNDFENTLSTKSKKRESCVHFQDARELTPLQIDALQNSYAEWALNLELHG
jgi:hypothetical protein